MTSKRRIKHTQGRNEAQTMELVSVQLHGAHERRESKYCPNFVLINVASCFVIFRIQSFFEPLQRSWKTGLRPKW